MGSKLSLGLVIGGAVSSTMRSAFTEVQGHIKKLEQQGNKAKVLKSTIGETIRLRDEWKRAHDSGSASATGLLRKLDRNLETLRKQGVAVGRLNQEYQRLGRTARATDLKVKGHQQIEQGKAGLKSSVGQAVVGVGAVAIPTKISADYQAIIRDIAIKADVANKPQEAEMTRTVIQTANDTGMARNDVADLVNQLVGAGMDLNKALDYAPVAAKFAIGQGASGVDTASMIQALQQNAKITDPKVMEQALEAIALQGQAGSFEAADMARWFPQLLAGMEKNGSTGMDAVSSLGAMLQVQMKTAGGSDEAANNLKNWMEKIGSGEVVKAYKDAGIDYQASLNTGIQKGMSTLESSFDLAMKYIQATDPAKAAKMAEAQAKISKETDPEKAKAMLNALEQSLRTGDIFADMQVKAALTAYAANRGLYDQLKKDSQNASGILDKNLAERRQTSSQIWAETYQAVNDSMRSIGDAIRPMTDGVAKAITATAQGFTGLSDNAKPLIAGVVALGAGFVALKSAFSAFKFGKGLLNVARGSLGGGTEKVQKVFVTNAEDGGEDDKPAGKRDIAIGLLETGLKALAGDKGEGDEAGEGGESKEFDPIDTGLKVLDLFRASNDEDGGGAEGGESNEPQKVFVVNASAIGGGGAGEGGRSRRRRGGSSRRRSGQGGGGGSGGGRNGSRSAAPRPPRVPRPPTPVPAPAAAGGLMTRLAGTAGKLSPVLKATKAVPGAAVLDAGIGIMNTYQNATTQDEKAEGYGSAAGGLAGTMAGAAAGAAIGSVVPVVGTLIGGAIGAFLGGMGGESLGGMLGKSFFGEDKEEAVAKQDGPDKAAVPGDAVRAMAEATPPPAATAAIAKVVEPAKQAPQKVDQQFSFSPSVQLTVQGDVKAPAQFARDLDPHLRRLFDEYSRNAANRQLSDEPHV
ncbi:phage tail tape measure protein [Pseudomonas donghuensis]|uniref:phage tail tape measure protein n=1 Tax=Pseudomonas donghuensis TaxID=1163398 RepID=UPI0027151C11|nr:phage tail tape measure protein [Pseudomonas donghuensis]WKY30299.1 phage tail tape measure protein [Pseudomonas donghuensis]